MQTPQVTKWLPRQQPLWRRSLCPAQHQLTHDPVEARANQRMLERAQRVIVVADQRKIRAVTMSKIADIGKVDLLITEQGASPSAIAELRAAGLAVELV